MLYALSYDTCFYHNLLVHVDGSSNSIRSMKESCMKDSTIQQGEADEHQVVKAHSIPILCYHLEKF